MRKSTLERYAYVLAVVVFHAFHLIRDLSAPILPALGSGDLFIILLCAEALFGVLVILRYKTITCIFGSYLFYHGLFMVFIHIYGPLVIMKGFVGMLWENYVYIAIGLCFMAAGIRLIMLGLREGRAPRSA